MQTINLGKYLTLKDFCCCTQTYQKYSDRIDPFPKTPETIEAIKQLNQWIMEPIVEQYGIEKFKLTYGFCSPELKKYLNQKDPSTGSKNGRIDPQRDQHMAHERNRHDKYYCSRLGAACDFLIVNVESDRVVDWILFEKLPFDSMYFYGKDKPIHISYGPQHKRDIWAFTATGMPTRKGIKTWIELAKSI